MYPVRNEVNNKNVKTEENVRTKKDSRGEKDVQNNIKSVSIVKHENKVKQDNYEDIEKNFICTLMKMDTPYNLAFLRYTNYKFKYMMLEDASQEKQLIHQEHA